MIEVYDFDKDIYQCRFRKLNIYYDELINPMYYHYLCENHGYTLEMNNQKNRNGMIRFIIIDYRDMLIEKGFAISDHEEESEESSDEEDQEDENDIYICHHCVKYTTSSMSDMIRHFKRKNKCNQLSKYNYDDSIILSKKRRYNFLFSRNDLTINDYLFIIENYTDKINMINNHFNDMLQINKEIPCENTEIKEGFICNTCKLSFLNKANLKRHLLNKAACKKREKNERIFLQNM